MKDSRTFTQPGTGFNANIDRWLWTVGSPNNPTAIEQFYKAQLPGQGWQNVTGSADANDSQTLGCLSTQVVGAQAAKQYQMRDASGKVTTFPAPAGGSALEIDLVTSSNQALIAAFCSGIVSPSGQ